MVLPLGLDHLGAGGLDLNQLGLGVDLDDAVVDLAVSPTLSHLLDHGVDSPDHQFDAVDGERVELVLRLAEEETPGVAALRVDGGLDVGHVAHRVPEADLLGVGVVAGGLGDVIQVLECIVATLLRAGVAFLLQVQHSVFNIVALTHELLKEVAGVVFVDQISGLSGAGCDADLHEASELVELDGRETAAADVLELVQDLLEFEYLHVDELGLNEHVHSVVVEVENEFDILVPLLLFVSLGSLILEHVLDFNHFQLRGLAVVDGEVLESDQLGHGVEDISTAGDVAQHLHGEVLAGLFGLLVELGEAAFKLLDGSLAEYVFDASLGRGLVHDVDFPLDVVLECLVAADHFLDYHAAHVVVHVVVACRPLFFHLLILRVVDFEGLDFGDTRNGGVALDH